MLVLGRKVKQSIIFRVKGIEIKVEILRIQGSVVRFGIEAPKEVSIFRDELLHKKFIH